MRDSLQVFRNVSTNQCMNSRATTDPQNICLNILLQNVYWLEIFFLISILQSIRLKHFFQYYSIDPINLKNMDIKIAFGVIINIFCFVFTLLRLCVFVNGCHACIRSLHYLGCECTSIHN